VWLCADPAPPPAGHDAASPFCSFWFPQSDSAADLLIFDQSVAVRSFPQISERRTQSPEAPVKQLKLLKLRVSRSSEIFIIVSVRSFCFLLHYCTGSTVRLHRRHTLMHCSTEHAHTHTHTCTRSHTHAHTHTHTHTYTHTHSLCLSLSLTYTCIRTHTHICTRVCFCELWVLSIDFYCFYTDQTIFSIPNPKPTPYRKPACILTFSGEHHWWTSFTIFYHFSPLVGTAGHSPQCQKCLIWLSLWIHLVLTM